MRGYLELIRIFLTPSAVADSYAGLVLGLARPEAGAASAGQAAAVAGASACAYWMGMAANDILDRDRDRRNAPARPIPSGRVSIRGAIALSAALCALAIGLGILAGAPWVVAGILVSALAYDAGGKRIPGIGALLMGLCRSLNLLLGAAAVLGTTAALTDPAILGAAAILGAYIAGVTAVSRLEESPFAPALFHVAALPLIAVPLVMAALAPADPLNLLNAAALAALLAGAIRSSTRAPEGVHGAAVFVRNALGGIFLVDAGLIFCLAPGGSALWPRALILYGLFALAWIWKQSRVRRGEAGS